MLAAECDPVVAELLFILQDGLEVFQPRALEDQPVVFRAALFRAHYRTVQLQGVQHDFLLIGDDNIGAEFPAFRRGGKLKCAGCAFGIGRAQADLPGLSLAIAGQKQDIQQVAGFSGG